ncbi:MAG TPA: hypothetical protein VFS05_03820 [Gemmatimonadaceae bacterium]|nr:hypothetical protein [Gemmatimonadaceae bacterium]
MPHSCLSSLGLASSRRAIRRAARLSLLSAALATLLACAAEARHQDGSAAVDSTAVADGEKVAGTASSSSPPISIPSGPRGDSIRTLLALRDSAATLESRFALIRDSANAQAMALRSLDRRSADYARRFDEWSRLAARADSVRQLRDRARARAQKLRGKLGPTAAAD